MPMHWVLITPVFEEWTEKTDTTASFLQHPEAEGKFSSSSAQTNFLAAKAEQLAQTSQRINSYGNDIEDKRFFTLPRDY